MTERGIATLVIRLYGLYLIVSQLTMLTWLLISKATSTFGPGYENARFESPWSIFGYHAVVIGVGMILLAISDPLIRFVSKIPGASNKGRFRYPCS